MKEFNFAVTIVVQVEEVASVSVNADTEQEARKIVKRMFDNGELNFETFSDDIIDFHIERE